MTNKPFFWKLQDNILDKENKQTLIKFIQSTDRFTQFEEVKKFEREWSAWQGRKHSVFVNSGSSAILVIISALKEYYKWEKDTEIIVPAITWITDISVLLQLELKPVFVDVNLEDFSFDYDDLASKITSKTKAIFLTHLIGFPADVNKVKQIIGKKKIHLIEDCCESPGATISGTKIGNFGMVSLFSFYWGHHMTTVEGGMICTDNKKLYHLFLLKRSHGLARELPKNLHQYYKNKHKDIDFNFLFLTNGFNVRNTELNAVLGSSQLKKLDGYIEQRNKTYDNFLNIINHYPEFLLTPYNNGISSFSLPLILKKQYIKNRLQKFLTRNGVETRPIIGGNLLRQPFLKSEFKNKGFPNAEFLHKNAFYIGNNQFVNSKKLNRLKELLDIFFSNPKNITHE
ncbi:CDP-4-keto-6-deoxy-D-glucose-3-dehydrase [Candidatus Roizmanbacteria bacterium CG10_big_fil_rev_8_21_14_0_10_39_12]|uniref:CDP-4-keto-6-deoxy-D-glucose-3-dehydrase n=1 Tax=Candidatus Roizmanbacteria bacterium CG10_big_fil_rev_8_21_14_0_10_39_12 TaxID=1974852 RepID=A0A2M8KMZ9_9BACT|nr:MAG: CDP-4-keto-6-deoxy-D-glucose-3-dehydrase [Candidatus Roizmanbacteria bacterium CG10_big_fil_rev_8_21_14_0_10_39_12]